jgi:pimeloyl-ACP methyl ester carboxylesterase
MRPMPSQISDQVDPLEGAGGQCLHHEIEVEDGVVLRVFEWSGQKESSPPMLLVAGWITIIDSWLPVLAKVTENRRLIYVESREKASAEIRPELMHKESFRVECLGRDIAAVAAGVGLNLNETVMVGSSLGANAILEGLKLGARCRAAFLIGPNAEFAFPLWSRFLMRLPPEAYRPLVPLILWYLRHFRLDIKAEPEQYERYRRTAEGADFERLKLSALALEGFRVIEGFENILDPVGVAFASTDRLHGEVNARRLAEALPRGTALECPSNAFLHRPEVIGEIDKYVRMVS